ncbi:AAA family ATPase [Streptomyces hydrogenans]|uniref:AAA family ATPase n=1 Tax=Streptomyces hydrogenans TaxID=1873719 RepID=UPI0035D97534
MATLARAYRAAGEIGEALPHVFDQFALTGVDVRRGTVTLIGAAPGGAKSVLANAYALRARVPTLFFSADTNEAEVAERLAAMMTGRQISECRSELNPRHPAHRPETLALLDGPGSNHIDWEFEDAPSYEFIVKRVEAFFYEWAVMPELIVIDNLINIKNSKSDEVEHDVDAIFFLKTLARKTQAAVVVLHHLTGEHESGDTWPGQSAFKGKIAKYVALALTLSRDAAGTVWCHVVKNRSGEADPTGKRVKFPFETDLSRARLR